jgi:hypothetical protein
MADVNPKLGPGVDDLLGALRAAGRRETTGGFTLDAAKARDKLREFQLADPSRYILLLMQAMVLRGATHIAVTSDADDIRVIGHGAAAFTREELTDFYVLLFDDRPPPGVREIALALNAAMALDPRWVRLEGAAADGRGFRLEQRNDAADRIEVLSGATHGIVVHVRERFRVAHFVRFITKGGHARERNHVAEASVFAGIPITLDGQAIARATLPEVEHQVRVQLHGRDLGVVGLAPSGPGRLALVRHQVLIATDENSDPDMFGVRGVVDVSHLRTDASVSQIVRDELWTEVLVAVRDAADEALAERARCHPRDEAAWAGLHALLCRRIDEYRTRTSERDAARRRDFLGVALWRTSSGARLSTADVLALPEVCYTHSAARPVPDGFAQTLVVSQQDAARLASVTEGRAKDVTFELHRAVTRDSNRRQYEARKVDGKLSAANDYAQVVRFERSGIRGVVGYPSTPGPSWIRIVVDGCLLCELPLPTPLPLSTIHVVVQGPFSPTPLFDGVERDETFAAAAHAMLCAVAQVVSAELHARRVPALTPELADFVVGVLDGTWATRLLARLGLPATLATASPNVTDVVARYGDPWRRPFVRGLPERVDHPFAAMQWFEDGAGTPISLQQILDAVGPTHKIPVITFSRPKLERPPMLVVRVDARRMQILEHLVGGGRIEKLGADFERWLARERFDASPHARVPEIDASAIVHALELEHEARPVRVLLLRDREASTSWSVVIEGRHVASIEGPAVRGLTGHVTLAREHLNARCDGIVDEGKRVAVAAMSAAVLALVAGFADARPDDERVADFFIDVLGLACPTSTYVRLWKDLHARHDAAWASTTYCRALRLGGEWEPDRVARSIHSTLGRRGVFELEEVQADLSSARRVKSSWADHREAAASVLPRVLAVACIRAGAVAQASLQQVFDAVGQSQPARYLPSSVDAPDELEGAIRLDAANLARLQRIVGSASLVDDSPRIATIRKHSAFMARPQLESLALAEGAALASIIVSIEGFRGVLGVQHQPPVGSRASGKIVVCCRQRPVAELTTPAPWIGILDGSEVGLESDYEGLTEREVEWVMRLLDLHRAPMIDALVAAAANGADADLARQWVQHFLRAVLPRHEHHQPAFDDAGLGDIVGAPLFLDAAGGGLSIRDVRTRFGAEGRITFVRGVGLDPGRSAIVVRDETEEALVRHMFDDVADVHAFATGRASFMMRSRAAAPLPIAPGDALVVEPIDNRQLRGALWIPAIFVDAPKVAFGPGDRVVDEQELSTMFPCCGGIGGSGVEIAEDWSGTTLSRARADHLKSRATKLYTRLVRELPAGGPSDDDPRLPWLRALMQRLREIASAGRSWPSHEMRALYRDLREVPLVAMANGRLVSWQAAERAARPEVSDTAPPSDIDDAPPVAEAHVTVAAEPTAPPPVAEAIEPARQEPPARPKSPPQRLRDAVLDELRLLHRRSTSVLAEACIETIRIEPRDGRLVAFPEPPTGAVIDSRHPVVVRAMAADADPLLISLVASAALTALNVALAELADTDEALLVRLHANHLATASARTP